MALIYSMRVTNKYPLIVSHPGIGTSAIIFADEIGRRIVRLALIEDELRRKTILENNLNLYGFRRDPFLRQRINISQDFNRVDENYLGGVAIFHPTINFRGLLPPAQPSAGTVLTQQDIMLNSQKWLSAPISIGPASRSRISIRDIIDKVRNDLQLSLFLLPIDFRIPNIDPTVEFKCKGSTISMS